MKAEGPETEIVLTYPRVSMPLLACLFLSWHLSYLFLFMDEVQADRSR